MGRRKIQIQPLSNERNRSVTFLKRKAGLFKKAHELAVLCQVDISVLIIGHNNKLYEFSSCDSNKLLKRFRDEEPYEKKAPSDFDGSSHSKGGKDSKGSDDEDEDDFDEHDSDSNNTNHEQTVTPSPSLAAKRKTHSRSNSKASNTKSPALSNATRKAHSRKGSSISSHATPSNGSVDTASTSTSTTDRPAPPQQSAPPNNGQVTIKYEQPLPQTAPAPLQYQQQQQGQPVQYNQSSDVQGRPTYIPMPYGVPNPMMPRGPMQFPIHLRSYPEMPNQQSSIFYPHNRINQYPYPQQPQQMQPPTQQMPTQQPPQQQGQSQQQQPQLQLRQPQPVNRVTEPATSVGALSKSEEAIKIGTNEASQPPKQLSLPHLPPRSHSADGTTTFSSTQRTSAFPPLNPIRTVDPFLNSSNPSTPSPTSAKDGLSMRPKLKVQIPLGGSNDGQITSADKSKGGTLSDDLERRNGPRGPMSAGPMSAGPLTGSNGGSNWGTLFLPPPSPSSYLTTNTTTGPGNPFSRPSLLSNNNGEQTPLSAALPSKYVNELLPSPSNFYGSEWSFQFGSGPTSAGVSQAGPSNSLTTPSGTGPSFLSQRNNHLNFDMLPSPLQFNTPVVASSSQSLNDNNTTSNNSNNNTSAGSSSVKSPPTTAAAATTTTTTGEKREAPSSTAGPAKRLKLDSSSSLRKQS